LTSRKERKRKSQDSLKKGSRHQGYQISPKGKSKEKKSNQAPGPRFSGEDKGKRGMADGRKIKHSSKLKVEAGISHCRREKRKHRKPEGNEQGRGGITAIGRKNKK